MQALRKASFIAVWAVIVLAVACNATADEADKLLAQAGEAYAKGDLDKAIADYTEAIRLKPDHADAYYARSNAYNEKGDHNKATADRSEAVRLRPEHAARYQSRALTYPSLYFVLYLPWLLAGCLIILLAAAFLHWQRTRHWCLLTPATGSLMMAMGIIVGQIVQRLFAHKLLRSDLASGENVQNY